MPETDPWVDFKIDADSEEEEGKEGRNDDSDDETAKKSNSEESEHEETHEQSTDATSSAVDKNKVEKAKKINSNTKARWSGKSGSQRLGPPLIVLLLAGQHLILNLN